MNWINPREKLPNDKDIVWGLVVEHYPGERVGNLHSANIRLYEIQVDIFGVAHAALINHKGMAYGTNTYFFEWYPVEWDTSEYSATERSLTVNNRDDLLLAWMPFSEADLPIWETIGIDESISIITANPKYKEGRSAISESEKRKQLIKNARESGSFIRIEDAYPFVDGVYVIATANNTALCKYEEKSCQPWHYVDGMPVLAWYPVPDSY